MTNYDTIIIGAGAAGLMCAIEAGKRGRRVLIIDHAKAVGEKIRISGGGRCNFTNRDTSPAHFLSSNPHFCISALKRFNQYDFIDLVEQHGIAYHEKTLGQLFCDGSSKQIIEMLLNECQKGGVHIRVECSVTQIEKQDDLFSVSVSSGEVHTSSSVVIATGGPSIPKMGATGWGYDIAKQFGLKIIEPRPALVPFTLSGKMLESLQLLSGVSVDATVICNGIQFHEGLLFTHRGLSGPVMLQISSYWKERDPVTINLVSNVDLFAALKKEKQSHPKQDIQTTLTKYLPKRLAQYICLEYEYLGTLADLSHQALKSIANTVQQWQIIPSGTEGYRTAEVTLGGVDTNEISSKTFEANKVPGLYFIGEVVDVTGHLGGFNFQWAWSSGHAAGQYV